MFQPLGFVFFFLIRWFCRLVTVFVDFSRFLHGFLKAFVGVFLKGFEGMLKVFVGVFKVFVGCFW